MDVALLPALLATRPPPFIHIHDPLSNLRFLSANAQIDAAQHAFVRLDCTECITPKVLYTHVINGLARWVPRWDDACHAWGGPDVGVWDASWDTFVHALRTLVRTLSKGKHKQIDGQNVENKSILIIFDNADRLRDFMPALVVPLTRLAELSQLPITTLFVTPTTWTDIRPPLGASPSPLLVFVPPLTREEVIGHLESLFPDLPNAPRTSNYHPSLLPLYEYYINALYSICAPTTTDVEQIAYIAAARWPGFVAPIINDWIAARDDRHSQILNGVDQDVDDDDDSLYPLPTPMECQRLLNYFKPSFTDALSNLLPRLTSARSWAMKNAPSPEIRLSEPASFSSSMLGLMSPMKQRNGGIDREDDAPPVPGSVAERVLGLTRRQKILLIATYVASFNPAKTDSRMFERVADGGRKRRKRKAGSRKLKPGTVAKLSRQITGPAAFSLERLFALYHSILMEVEGDVVGFDREMSRVQVLSSIPDLLRLHLLQRTGISSALSANGGLEDATKMLDMSTNAYRANIEWKVVRRLCKSLKMGDMMEEILWDAER